MKKTSGATFFHGFFDFFEFVDFLLGLGEGTGFSETLPRFSGGSGIHPRKEPRKNPARIPPGSCKEPARIPQGSHKDPTKIHKTHDNPPQSLQDFWCPYGASWVLVGSFEGLAAPSAVLMGSRGSL